MPGGWPSSALLVGACSPAPAGRPTFSVPPALRPQVEFWIGVFATYSRHQDVIHDTEHLDRVYSVLDFRDLEAQGVSDGQIDGMMRAQEDAEKARVRAMLYRLQEDPDPATLTAEELRLQGLFANDPSPTKYMDAAASDRLRGQRGLRERFAQGIAIAHAYFPYMEEIFRRNGVPIEITRLPLVESTFNMKAYSKVGAAGVWQFMPGTARNFMRVDDVVDERLDPLVATARGGDASCARTTTSSAPGRWRSRRTTTGRPAWRARCARPAPPTSPRSSRTTRGRPSSSPRATSIRSSSPRCTSSATTASTSATCALHPPLRAETVVLAGPMSITTAARCAGADVVADQPS